MQDLMYKCKDVIKISFCYEIAGVNEIYYNWRYIKNTCTI